MSRALLAWFDQHRRDLPWRRTRDPYAIWVSEIMLQQTRVAAVLEHYARWMEQFPTVDALARAEEAEVLAVWSGLGYYRRARMLHRAAQAVVAEHGGVLPHTAEALRTLPGIGEYTSAAVASIAFGEQVAVVDGNVERVVMRLEGFAEAGAGARQELPADFITERTQAKGVATEGGAIEGVAREGVATAASLARAIRAGATDLLVSGRAGDSNQAMMELGATVCLPRAPLCLSCPLQTWCQTRGEHATAKRKPQLSKAIAYGLAESLGGSTVLLSRRSATVSLMAGMWELPELAQSVPDRAPVLQLQHGITVTNYAVSILRLDTEEAARVHGDLRWTPLAELPQLPLTGLARKVLRRLGLWPGSLDGAALSKSMAH